VASRDRKITDCIGFSVIFGRYSVFSGFLNTEVGSVSVLKNIGYRFGFSVNRPTLRYTVSSPVCLGCNPIYVLLWRNIICNNKVL